MYILICFGTYHEYINIKSVIDHVPNIKTCFIGQRSILLTNIKTDYEISILDNMSENKLDCIIATILKYSHIFDDIDYVLTQGCTHTALAMVLSASRHGKKIIHLESELRYEYYKNLSHDINIQEITKLVDIHLCFTESNKQILIDNNASSKIYVVGNTRFDNITRGECAYGNQVLIIMYKQDDCDIIDKWLIEFEKIANKYPNIEFTIQHHQNSNIRAHMHLLRKVKVIDPMTYDDLISYIKKCRLIISDSSELYEECFYLNKKIIIYNETAERPRPECVGKYDFICEGSNKLEKFVDDIMNNYIINVVCPYGDGKSWERIKNIYQHNFIKIYCERWSIEDIIVNQNDDYNYMIEFEKNYNINTGEYLIGMMTRRLFDKYFIETDFNRIKYDDYICIFSSNIYSLSNNKYNAYLFNKFKNHDNLFIIGVGAQIDSMNISDDTLKNYIPGDETIQLFRHTKNLVACRGYITKQLLDMKYINSCIVGCPTLFSLFVNNNIINKLQYVNNPQKILASPTMYTNYEFNIKFFNFIINNKLDMLLCTEKTLFLMKKNNDMNINNYKHINDYSQHVQYLEYIIKMVSNCNNIYFPVSLDDNINILNKYDLFISTRFHASIINIFLGKPTIMIVHDSRTLELCKTMYVPYIEFNTIINNYNLNYIIEQYNEQANIYNNNIHKYIKNYYEYFKNNAFPIKNFNVKF